MDFPQPLVRGRLLRRYKRFFADVALDDGHEVVAHAANPGAMLGLAEPGRACWLSPAASPTRKLAWTLELIEAANGAPVLVNTHRPNDIVAEAVERGAIAKLAGYETLRREVRYGEASRIDLLLERAGRRPCFVEVKSVTLSRVPGLAEWPDCVSARGARHVAELATQVESGARAVVLFLVGRSDCNRFAPAADLDPAFTAALARARNGGVEVLVCACAVTPERIVVAGAL